MGQKPRGTGQHKVVSEREPTPPSSANPESKGFQLDMGHLSCDDLRGADRHRDRIAVGINWNLDVRAGGIAGHNDTVRPGSDTVELKGAVDIVNKHRTTRPLDPLLD